MGGGGGTACDESLGRGIDLKNCHCQPLLDLLCKFHHLDADIVYGEHSAEEIHHCDRPADAKGAEYKIIHCGCLPTTECQKCEHDNKKACMARKTHAISLKVVTAALHIDFVSTGRFIKNAMITVEFDKRCPKNPGYYHMQTADFGCHAFLNAQIDTFGQITYKNIDNVFLENENKIRNLERELFDAKRQIESNISKLESIKKAIGR
jgi:hypothetical protein